MSRPERDYDDDTAPPVEGDHYAEDTPLLWILGDKPKIKILAALLSERNHDLNISDLARIAGVSRSTIYDHIDPLIEYGLVEKTRETGGSQMYQIDVESDGVKFLAGLERWLLNQELEIDD